MQNHWTTSGLDLLVGPPAGAGRRAGLEGALRAAIRDGRLPAGSAVPSSRALAADLGLSRGTVTAAYDQLVAEGFLVARRGSGTVVADLPARERPAPPAPPAPPAAPAPERALDLRPGSPDVGSFPVDRWLRAARVALTGAPPEVWGYGDPRGPEALREALAGYLGRTRGVSAHPDRIVVTTGSVQALAVLARATGSEPVAMEDPGLPFHREVVRRAGRGVVPLPVDELGARTDLLDGVGASLAVLTPAHQYPLGVPLAPARRHRLVDWARSGGLVLEDDYDGEFRYDRHPVGAVQAMAPEHVVYVGSAAKTLAPGLRLAWLVLPERLVEPVVETRRHLDLHGDVAGQLTLAELMGSHAYDRHVRAMRLRYRRRRDLLLGVLERRTARHARALVPLSIAAGLQATLRLDDEAAVLERAHARGLLVEGLSAHGHGPQPRTGLVVGFGRPREAAYPRALEVLASVLP